MTFEQVMEAVAYRQREPEMLQTKQLTVDVPYMLRDDLEQIVVMALNQTLREVTELDYEAIGNDAIQIVTGGTALSTFYSYLNLPANVINVLGASVDGEPSVLASPANFFQFANVATRSTNRFTLSGGQCLFKGTVVLLTLLVEPSLTTWKANRLILPAGYYIRAIDLAHKRIQVADYVPAWRP